MGKPSMHTTQWLSSEQSNIAVQGLLGCGGTWLFGFSYGGINIGGRIKQSFYPRTRHGELKVISMIYAPPFLIRRRAEGEVDRTLATSPTVTPRAQKATNTGKQTTVHHYYYGAPQDQGGNTIQRTTTSHLPSRAVTNKLSGASVTHDDVARLRWFKLFRYR